MFRAHYLSYFALLWALEACAVLSFDFFASLQFDPMSLNCQELLGLIFVFIESFFRFENASHRLLCGTYLRLKRASLSAMINLSLMLKLRYNCLRHWTVQHCTVVQQHCYCNLRLDQRNWDSWRNYSFDYFECHSLIDSNSLTRLAKSYWWSHIWMACHQLKELVAQLHCSLSKT